MVANIENKLSLDSDEIRAPEKPIRTINRRAVYGCYFLAALASGTVIYSLVSSSSPKEASVESNPDPVGLDNPSSLADLPKYYDEVVITQPMGDDMDQFDKPRVQTAPRYNEQGPVQEKIEFNNVESEKKQRDKDEIEAAERSGIHFLSNSSSSESRHARQNSDSTASSFGSSQPSTGNILFGQNQAEPMTDKERFMHSGSSGPKTLKAAYSKYAVMQGTILPAVLLTEINSDLPGPILGQVTTNIFDTRKGKYLLIPQGSKVVGEYNSSVSYGQQRAQIAWTRIILPNGNSVDLGRMPGMDSAGASGARGKVDQHFDHLAVSVLITSLLGAGVGMTQGPINPNSVTPQQVIGQSVAQEVARAGTKIAEKTLDIQPTIKVKAGTKINVFATDDFLLEPYRH